MGFIPINRQLRQDFPILWRFDKSMDKELSVKISVFRTVTLFLCILKSQWVSGWVTVQRDRMFVHFFSLEKFDFMEWWERPQNNNTFILVFTLLLTFICIFNKIINYIIIKIVNSATCQTIQTQTIHNSTVTISNCE